jgi:hypothetical protein
MTPPCNFCCNFPGLEYAYYQSGWWRRCATIGDEAQILQVGEESRSPYSALESISGLKGRFIDKPGQIFRPGLFIATTEKLAMQNALGSGSKLEISLGGSPPAQNLMDLEAGLRSRGCEREGLYHLLCTGGLRAGIAGPGVLAVLE